MSRRHGQYVVTWLQRGGERFLRATQPYVYQTLLFHTGATDILRAYHGADDYWRYVQAILDNFFTSAQRAELCKELISNATFSMREDFEAFLIEARAEIRVQDLIASVEVAARVKATAR